MAVCGEGYCSVLILFSLSSSFPFSHILNFRMTYVRKISNKNFVNIHKFKISSPSINAYPFSV